MTGFNHGMNGAVIGLAINQPAIAIPLAFASHYAADFVPHYGFKSHRNLNRFTIVDFVISITIMAILGFMFPEHRILIWACMVAAAIPDLVWWFYRKTFKEWPRTLDRFTAWHFKINNHVRHIYFDAAWFGLVWAAVLWFKLR